MTIYLELVKVETVFHYGIQSPVMRIICRNKREFIFTMRMFTIAKNTLNSVYKTNRFVIKATY